MLLAFALASTLVAPSALGDCTCHRPEKGEKTRRGANLVIIETEEGARRRLEGTVFGIDDHPFENVLVEIFNHPEHVSENAGSMVERHKQKRLAVCRTAADGKFCFRGLPSGKYELRASLNDGWNITHLYVTVDTEYGKSEPIRVRMYIGI